MTTTSPDKSVLIIGASRGLGLAMAAAYVARGWQVTATVRGTTHTGLHDLAASGRLTIEENVDITVPQQLAALHGRVETRDREPCQCRLTGILAGIGADIAAMLGLAWRGYGGRPEFAAQQGTSGSLATAKGWLWARSGIYQTALYQFAAEGRTAPEFQRVDLTEAFRER